MEPENDRERLILKNLDLDKLLPEPIDSLMEKDKIDENGDIFEMAR